MHNIVLIATKMDVHVARYLVVSYDEVTMINYQSWVNFHASYILKQQWCLSVWAVTGIKANVVSVCLW
jgi:hypothetical protein